MAKRRKKPASTKYILGGIAALIVICSITLVLVAVKSRSVYAEVVVFFIIMSSLPDVPVS